jgi:recombination protein RecA
MAKKKDDEQPEKTEAKPEKPEKAAKGEKAVADDRDEQLSAYFKLAEKNYGKGAVQFAVDHGHENLPRITTGILPLDISLGGGLPVGRISMFYGPKSSSKTTCFLRSLGRAQRMCSNCWTPAFSIWKVDTTGQKPRCKCGSYRKVNAAWLDVEGVWDEAWSRRFLDISRVVFSSPETGEQACDVADSLLRSGAVDIVVIDSVAFMEPTAEIERSASEPTVGSQARLLGTMFRKLVSGTNSVSQRDGRRPTVWFTNQIRNKVGVMFGNPETVPGGYAQGFATSTETRMSPGKYQEDKESGVIISVEMKFRNEKNKTGVAKMEGEYKLQLSDTEVKKAGDVCDEEYAFKIAQQCGLVIPGRGHAPTKWNGMEFDARSLLERHWMINRDEYEDFKLKLIDHMRTPVIEHEAQL